VIADSDESCGSDRHIKHGSMLIASFTIAYVMKPSHTQEPIAMNDVDPIQFRCGVNINIEVRPLVF